MGVAWGPRCQPCPVSGTDDYKQLCMDSGYTIEGYGKTIPFFFSFVSYLYNFLLFQILMNV
jgi:hypothetical protein